jgi:hypothetical protein
MKTIITFDDKYTVVNNSGLEEASFSNITDAKNYVLQTQENIIEYPFYEVDEHGQPIG